MAHEAGLPLELRTRLQRLESVTPAPGSYNIDELVARELGTVAGLTPASEALAEGSVAFIVPFTWTGGPAALPPRGVFKALKPHAEEQLFEDLAIWPDLGDYLEERTAHYGLTSLDFRATLDGVARLLRNEIRLDREQTSLERARRFYADSPDVLIPQLFPLCTPRLTAMERIDGPSVTDPALSGAARRSLARTIVVALLAKPLWSPPANEAFFHADPHAGNLLAADDGRLGIIDWALTTQLSEAQLGAVVRALLGAATLDEVGIMHALGVLGEIKRAAAVRESVAAAVARVRRGVFPGFAWLTPLLDGLARSGSMTFPEATTLFRKSLLTLTGVVADVAPGTSIDDILIRSGSRQFIDEVPQRAIASSRSRAFGTHVSNADLFAFWGSLALTPTRYALGTYVELLDLLKAGVAG